MFPLPRLHGSKWHVSALGVWEWKPRVYYVLFPKIVFIFPQVLAFVEEHKKVLGSLRATRKAIEQIRSNMAWLTTNEKAVTEWLEGKVKAIKE